MSRKITQRLFILMTVLIVTLSSLSSSLTVFADQYTGGGSGSASVSGVSDSDLNMSGSEYGVRIYCIND